MQHVLGSMLEKIQGHERTLRSPKSSNSKQEVDLKESRTLRGSLRLEIPIESPKGEHSPILQLSSRNQSNFQNPHSAKKDKNLKKAFSKSRSTVLNRQINDSKMEKYYRQAIPGASIYVPMQKSNATPLVHELNILLANMSEEERFKKAARHLDDALHLRAVRHDIDTSDSKLLKKVYTLQTNRHWQTFLYLLSWAFLALTFFEPPNSKVNDFFEANPDNLSIMLGIELPIVSLFLIELFLEIFHRSHDQKSWKDKFFRNKGLISKCVLNFLYLLDLIIFYSSVSHNTFRFSRFFRPFSLVLYSKQLRRTFIGMIKSIGHMFDIILFFMLITVIFAAIGVEFIGDLEGTQAYDPYASNFKDFGAAMNSLYVLFSRDNYPEVMLPALKRSYIYLIYFIPFVAINTLLFVPIPIAVIFDAFRVHRADLVVKERIKEREALVACFLTLDVDGKEEFMSLCQVAFRRELDEEKVDEIFGYLDENQTQNITLEDFFLIVELMEDTKNLKKPYTIEIKPWNFIRSKVNKYFKFDVIVNHFLFDLFMTIIILINTVVLVYYGFSDDPKTLAVLDILNDVLQYIYVAEIVVKIFGFGAFNYFSDKWNILDFCLTIVSLATDLAISLAKIARTAKAGRLFRINKTQRLFKLIATLRGAKLFKCCYAGFKSIHRIRRFIQDLILCFPIVLKLMAVLFMVTYLYAIIGMEIFNSKDQIYENSPYIKDNYANFNTFGGALLILFQVIVQASWSYQLNDLAYRFDDLTKSSLYFNTFNSITNFFIISLLTGLIWEVFIYMEKQFKEQDRINEKLEEIYYSQTQKLSTSIKTKKTMKYIVGDMSLSELDFMPGNERNSSVRRIKSFNHSDIVINNESPSCFGLEGIESNEHKNNFLSPSYSRKFTNSKYDSGNEPKISSKFKEGEVEREIKYPRRAENAVRLLSPLIGRDHDDEDRQDEQKSGVTIYLNEIDLNNYIEDKDFIQQEEILFNENNTKSFLGKNERENPNLDGPFYPEIKEILPTIYESMRSLESGCDEASFKGNACDLVAKDLKGFGSWPRDRTEARAKSFDSKKKTLSSNRNNNNSQFISQGALSSTRKIFFSKAPSLTPGDGSPIMAETEKAETLNDFAATKEENKEIKIFIEDENQENELLELDKIISFREVITDDAKSHMLRNKKRSGSYSLSTKFSNTPSGPIVNKLFVTDREEKGSNTMNPIVSTLEREFYSKKIMICTHISIEKNQLDYIQTKTAPNKNKFKQELKLLKLQSDSEDSDDMKGELSKPDPRGAISEAKTKHLESLKKKMQKKSRILIILQLIWLVDQPGDRILRKALLHNQDQDTIQKFEDNHFVKMYGKWYEYLKNPKIERIIDVFETENKILIRFMRLLKQNEIVYRDFVEIINMIEVSINKNLLRKGSIGKFLFKDVQGRWFFVFKEGYQLRIQYLPSGFWSYSQDIFKDPTKLYEGQDIFFPGQNEKYEEPVSNLFSALLKIVNKIPNSTLGEFERNSGLWNMYAIPFQASSTKCLKYNVLKALKNNSKIDITTLQDTLVTEGIFFSVNYVVSAKEASIVKEEHISNNNYNVEMERKATIQSGGMSQLLQSGKRNDMNRTSMNVQVSGPNTPINTINKKFSNHESLRNNEISTVSLGKSSTVENFLPLHEYIDFMKDIRDALNLHKDHLLLKFSTLYARLNSKTKN